MNKIQVRKYDLPDSYLYKNSVEKTTVKVWIPTVVSVILGRSNSPEGSLIIENIIKDKIPVYKRPSGGETVVLSPNTIIISIALQQSNFKGGKTYFNLINKKLKSILQEQGIKNVSLNGISDIVIDNVKILGSSLYQNKDVVFYHAVLNVSESTDVMERYLKHPTREPYYREKRNHKDFVTSLKDKKYRFEIKLLSVAIEKRLKSVIDIPI